ncbi:sodium:proline symporter, partial [Pectobacterium versatile]|nr:sodium:proline symporter [Pectobacterium versatile]
VGMMVGAATVIIWKQYGWLNLYEIIPGFLLSCAAIVVVSLLGRAPSATVTARFHQAEREFKSAPADA